MNYKYTGRVLALCSMLAGGSVIAQGEYKIFMTSNLNNQSDLYEIQLVGGNAEMTLLTSVNYDAHISFDDAADELLIYNSVTGAYQTWDANLGGDPSAPQAITVAGGGYVAATVSSDSKRLLGSANANNILQIFPDNTSDIYKAGSQVEGGDLAFLGETLYLATRTGGKLYEVTSEGNDLLKGYVPSLVTGMAQNADGTTLLVSAFDQDGLKEYAMNDMGMFEEVAFYPFTLDGEDFTSKNGDLASGFVGQDPIETGCFAVEVVEFEQGVQMNGQPVAANRSNPEEALGEPEDDDSNGAMNFVSLGDDGYITLMMGGVVVTDGTDAGDIRIVETTYGNPACASYPEYADIAVSADNITFYEVGTVCHNGEIDLDQFNLGIEVRYIRVANAEESNTPDYYDLDGVEAIWGCDEPSFEPQDCPDYRYYFTNKLPGQGSDLFEVELNGSGDASLTFITELLYEAHIALNVDNGLVYAVNADNSELQAINPADGSVVGGTAVINVDGEPIGTVPALLYADGILYAASAEMNRVYTVDPLTGDATFFADVRVSGGDLVKAADNIWYVNRSQQRLYNLTAGGFIELGVPFIQGLAEMSDGNVLVAVNGSSAFNVFSPFSGVVTSATFDAGDIVFGNGDLASGCVVGSPDFEETDNCFGTTILEYNPGTELDGSAIAANRLDGNNALGEPQRDNTINFATLGYPNGSITIGFDGAVADGPGADIEIVETSFSSNDCLSDGIEQAQVYVSQDDVNYIFAGTVCRDGFIDIADAGVGIGYITSIKIVNSEESTTFDGYDVDGVVVLSGACAEEEETTAVAPSYELNVYPNPFVSELNLNIGSEASKVEVEIYNGSRLIFFADAQPAGNGIFTVTNLAQRLPQNESVLGQYIVRVKVDGEFIGSKLIMDGTLGR